MARVRKNVWSLAAGDETLAWYGRAIAAMKARPIADPTSWRYQAAIHDYVREEDPLASSADALPSASEQRDFWAQCQHGSWYFLPWHRMYLHHFESIVAAEVERLGGPSDWALPYWNYSGGTATRLLPPAFRQARTDDGETNALYVEQRDPRSNAGDAFAHERDTDLRGCLRQEIFDSPAVGGSSSFGGPVTAFEHGGGTTGALETTPHGNMHVAVGGDSGWMSAFDTAALDPIFWLHHANINRLWQVWLNVAGAGHEDPSTADWLRSVSFQFHDAAGEVVTMTPAEVLDTTAAPLSYSYDDVSNPLAPAVAAAITRPQAMGKRVPSEMVGATAAPFELSEGPTHVSFAAAAPSPGLGVAPVQSIAGARRVYLNVENLTSSKRVPAYDVYLNVPLGDDPQKHEDLCVGRLPMFGLVEASRGQGKHPGSGMHYVLDVTDVVRNLSSRRGWDPNHLRVSFVPARKVAGARVSVGRVSLYVE